VLCAVQSETERDRDVLCAVQSETERDRDVLCAVQSETVERHVCCVLCRVRL